MYLSEFQIFNYKSFLDSGPIKLKPGFNVLTGQNNAGKTALLEALSLHFQSKPHRSLETASASESSLETASRALFRVAASKEDLDRSLPRKIGSRVTISVPKKDFPEGAPVDKIWELFSKPQEFHLEAAVGTGGQIRSSYVEFPDKKNVKEYWFLMLHLTPEGYQRGHSGGPSSESNIRLGEWFAERVYSFRAERMNIGLSKFGSDQALRPDASNLPEVLHVLQSTNPDRFRKYNTFVKRVFPQVEWVNVRPVGNHSVEILVWSVTPESERADLAVPLSESGTGISQVLAMLYVLVTAESPRTILIDEPNSFLHPGAVRVLVEILREHPQHQYILSTHSPELIAASNPSTIHILRRSQGVTQVESVDTQEARQFRTLLMEVGSRPSDVFGAENVLWVEGPTEQLCFPLIARHFLQRPLAGVSIVGVLHTGDFDAKKDTRSVFRIYERLTQGSALLPPAIAFIFDREIRPDKDRQDLERQSKGKVHFLSRRTYENYLLHAGALAAVMNEHPPFTDAPTDPAKVQAWLDAHCRKPEYYGKAKSQDYPQDIDAPKLLDALFGEFSENRLTYNKVEHSLALTEWLLAHVPEELKEIGELLGLVLPG